MKISFDYDETISTKKGGDLAKQLITGGNEVYIISARNLKVGIIDRAKSIGIPVSRVYATGSNENKIAKVKELNIDIHYDNNSDVIKELGSKGKLFTN